MIGLYEIKNTTDGKRYVGSSCHIERRLKDHKYLLGVCKHHSCKLQRAWDKHGDISFEFNVLVELKTEELKAEEQKLLDIAFKNRTEYYNVSIDAVAPTRGRKMSQETIQKKIKTASTKEWKDRQSASLKKYFSNPDSRKKASEIGKKLWENPEHKKKVTDAVALAAKRPEVREKRRLINLGRVKPPEAIEKLSKSLREKFSDPVFKQKFSGIIGSESVRKNMSKSAKIRWASIENKAEQSERTKNHFSKPENRARNSETTKAFFSNPENRKAAALRQPTKLSVNEIEFIRKEGAKYGMQTKLCSQFNLSKGHISNIVNGKSLVYTASL